MVNNTIYFILTVTVGSTVISKNFRYIEFPDFPVKEIAYMNNFGYYVYAYIDGQLNIDTSLSIDTYDQLNGVEKIIEINEDLTYTINSGSLLASEKAILTEIVNALSAKLFYNSEWIDMVGRTKKVKEYQERLNNYSENLVFGVTRNADIDNTFGDLPAESETPTESSTPPSSAPPSSAPPSSTPTESSTPPDSEPPTESRITLNSVEPSLFGSSTEGESCLDVSITLAPGYNPDEVIIIITPDGESPQEMTAGVDFPIVICSWVPGDYAMQIKEVETELLSNIIFYTIP